MLLKNPPVTSSCRKACQLLTAIFTVSPMRITKWVVGLVFHICASYKMKLPLCLTFLPEENIFKFAKNGLTPSQIGVILHDSHGIAQVNIITGRKIDASPNVEERALYFKMILRVTTAQLQLLNDYYCWKDYADRDEIKD
ncbi:40S ribosomal protein S13 [Tanacetum coccineum]